MSISLAMNAAPAAAPARWPPIRSRNRRPGVAVAERPIRSTSPRASRTTFHSSGLVGGASGAAAGSSQGGDCDHPTASTVSMNQPGAIRPVRSKASPLCTVRSQVAIPTTMPGAKSTTVTRATSIRAVRGTTLTRASVPGACCSRYTRAGTTPATSAGPNAVSGNGQAAAASAVTARAPAKSIAARASVGSTSISVPPPAQRSAGGRTVGSGLAMPSGSGPTARISSGVLVASATGGSRHVSDVPSSPTDQVTARRPPPASETSVTTSSGSFSSTTRSDVQMEAGRTADSRAI